MKKTTVDISIDDFMKLWDKVYKKRYEDIDPQWGRDITKIWKEEIGRKFSMKKSGGSYGPLEDDVMEVLLRSTEHTFLPRTVAYKDLKYAKKYPTTYKRFGDLERKMGSTSPYIFSLQGGKYSLKVKIPKTSRRVGGEKYKSVKNSNDPDGYMKLEAKRSFVKSSFVLVWPKILGRTMRGIK